MKFLFLIIISLLANNFLLAETENTQTLHTIVLNVYDDEGNQVYEDGKPLTVAWKGTRGELEEAAAQIIFDQIYVPSSDSAVLEAEGIAEYKAIQVTDQLIRSSIPTESRLIGPILRDASEFLQQPGISRLLPSLPKCHLDDGDCDSSGAVNPIEMIRGGKGGDD